MAQKTETQAPEQEKEDEKKNRNLAEYLQSPRRKRKNFVLLAMGSSMRGEITQSIASFVRSQFPELAIAAPKNPKELERIFSKQVVLLVYDDEFIDMHAGLELVKELKLKKKGNTPVLFLTRRPDELVRVYNEILLPFHEMDEYIAYPKLPINHTLSKIKSGLTMKNRRRTRRYPIDIPITFSRLSDDERSAGRIMDLSVHGAYIRSPQEQIFMPGDQVKLFIPVGNFLPPEEGDYLRLSGKVRRVFVSGNHAGVSFEYLTERQRFLLAKFLTGVVNSQVSRLGRLYKSRGSRQRT